MRSFVSIVISLFLLSSNAAFAQTAPAPAQAAPTAAAGTTIRGNLLDQQANLGVPGATIVLYRGGTPVARTRTDASGAFSFANQPPGAYYVSVSAIGYGAARSSDVAVDANDAAVTLSLVVDRAATNGDLREIGRVSASANSPTALQTTATITRRTDPQILLHENLSRVGAVLETLPGVNLRNKNTTIGDDLTVDIRGQKPSETQTLLDGHPIGPLGVLPGTSATFNYQDSPPFALRNIQATYGAGSLGLYGTNTTGGSIDLQTWDPTRTRQFFLEQGAGDQGKMSTNVRATGAFGRLGYALVSGVQGTYGPFAPQTVFNNGNLGTTFTTANIVRNTYVVSSNYLLRNDLLKLRWDFTPQTNLTLTGYSATSYDDKTGNGDNDSSTYPMQLSIAPVGKSASCPAGVLVTVDNGTQCMTPQQWAKATTGPQGAYGSYQAIGNQDYHARLVTSLGRHQIVVDGFRDAYNVVYNRNPSSYDPVAEVYNGGFMQNIYRTTGFLFSDDIVGEHNQFGFGYSAQHQLVTGNVYEEPNLIPRQPAALGDGNVFLRDAYTASSRLSVYGNLWVKSSTSTHGSTIDPRLSFVYRPTSSDVVRIGAAKSEGDPDPSLAGGNLNTTPVNINPPCGALAAHTGTRVNVGQIGNPSLMPETATDLEVAYSHRFAADSIVNLDLYDTNEAHQLFNINVPATQVATSIPADLLAQYFARIQSVCNITPVLDDLAFAQASNFSSARFEGVEISGRVRLNPFLFADYSYDLQSAKQLGVPDSILKANLTIINGSQILDIPLHKQSLGLDYATPGGFETRIDAEHLDGYNGLNRPGYIYANGFVRYATPRSTTFTFGVYNIFDTAALTYGQIGLGIFRAENQFGHDRNSFDEAVKLRGLTPRSFELTASQRM